jgi:hypothetical protein
VENPQIRVKTTGPSQTNLLPLYAYGITTSSSLDSTRGNHASRYNKSWIATIRFRAATWRVERPHQMMVELGLEAPRMWI